MKHSLSITLILLLGCKASTTPPPQHAPEPSFQDQARQQGLSSADITNTWMSRDIIGRSCRVALRRDALGMSAPGFAEPMSPMIGGKQALVSGIVDKLGNDWLVLRDKSRTYWIPVNAILMMETDAK
jgi:hypothetical protein